MKKVVWTILLPFVAASCAFTPQKTDNLTATQKVIENHEKKMRDLASKNEDRAIGDTQYNPAYLHKTSLAVVGPEGDVILFYKSGDKIIIQECERNSDIRTKSDCVPKRKERQVDVQDFKKRLKMALRVNKFDTLAPDYKNKVNDYIEAKMPLHLQEVLIALRDKAHWQIRKVVEFITAYGEENANKNEIEELDSKLSDLDEKIASHQDLADAVDAINQIIDRLVDQTMASSKMHTLKYSTDKGGIEYSVLSSYIYPYLAQMSFAEIPAGKFTMGSPNSEKNRYRDEKQVRVEISHGFEIGLTEVTQYQWFVVMGSNPSYIKDKKYCPQSFMVLGGISLCSDFPVEDVSWNDIEYYIREYNKRAKDGYTYRLPTEAEWEYAARAGTSTAFSFGDNPSMLKDYAWYIINSEMQTHNVASKKPNAWGLYDVHGNVWEWVSDNYHYTESYRLKDTVGLSRNPVGPSRGSTRVMRGGSSHNNWYNLRSASINYWGPGKSNYNIGFRLVRTK